MSTVNFHRREIRVEMNHNQINLKYLSISPTIPEIGNCRVICLPVPLSEKRVVDSVGIGKHIKVNLFVSIIMAANILCNKTTEIILKIHVFSPGMMMLMKWMFYHPPLCTIFVLRLLRYNKYFRYICKSLIDSSFPLFISEIKYTALSISLYIS